MKAKRTKNEVNNGIQCTLESFRRFDYDYVPSGDNWRMPDGDFKYRQNFFNRIITGFWRTLTKLFGPVLIGLVYGARVTGRKNLKELKGKGAICVCNHIAIIDTLFVRQAVGYFRSFHTMAATNNKTGVGGHIIRHGGMLPFSDNFAATKNLYAEMGRLLKKGKIINIYAEKAMWLAYDKPRPLKAGAFTYAVKFDVPVIPIFCTFSKNKKGRIKRLRINILPPVYPDGALKRSDRAAQMKSDTEERQRACYEKAYNKPLEYLPDRRSNATAITAE